MAAEDNLILEAIVVAQQKTEDMLDQIIVHGWAVRPLGINWHHVYQQMTAQLNSVTKDRAPDMQWAAVQSLRLASKATDKVAHDLYASSMICLFVTTMQHGLIKSCQ